MLFEYFGRNKLFTIYLAPPLSTRRKLYRHCYWSVHWFYKVGIISSLALKKMDLGEVREGQIWIFWACALSSYFVFKLKYKMIKLISCTFTKWPDNLEPEIFFSSTCFVQINFFNIITYWLLPSICGSRTLASLKFSFFTGPLFDIRCLFPLLGT